MVLAQKPDFGSSSKKELTTKEFVDFLVKKFGMSEGQAKREAFHHPPEQRELIMTLKEKMPETSFRTISNLLRQHPLDKIYKNLRVLEEHKIPPSVRLLGVPPVTLEKNIETLEENGYDPKQFILVLGANHSNLKENIKTSQERRINPAELTPISILGASPSEFREFLETPPAERTTKYAFLAVARYEFSDDAMKECFYDLVTRLHPHEQEAFKEIGHKIENEGDITKKEMQKIFKEHVTSRYPSAVLGRLDNILSSVVKDRGLEKWEEMRISLNVPAFLRKKLREKQDNLAGHPAWKSAKQESPGPSQEEKKATLEHLNRLLQQHEKDVGEDIMLLLRGTEEQKREIVDKYRDKMQGKG
ncbi:MAG: hypothetical protein NT130_05645 [Candidatus Micrarchaeota archaeon]|nr:hypothetical protein [Candidatus Micrarchaeota archaeon]